MQKLVTGVTGVTGRDEDPPYWPLLQLNGFLKHIPPPELCQHSPPLSWIFPVTTYTVSRGLRESRTQEGTHRSIGFARRCAFFFVFVFVFRFLCVFFIETVVSVALGGGARTVSIPKSGKT